MNRSPDPGGIVDAISRLGAARVLAAVAVIVAVFVGDALLARTDAVSPAQSRALLGATLWLVAIPFAIPLAVSRLTSDTRRVILAALAALALSFHVGLIGDAANARRSARELAFYHDSIGSRYFAELGHDGLYAATYRALIDIDPEFGARELLIRNLRSQRLEGTRTTRKRGDELRRGFPDDRWRAFRSDIATLHARVGADAWSTILQGRGWIASPFRRGLERFAMAAIEPTESARVWWSRLDVGIAIASLGIVCWAFAFEAAMLAALFLFANVASTPEVQGMVWRQLGIAGLLLTVGAYHRGRPRLAAIACALATLDSVYPLAFAIVPVVRAFAIAVRDRTRPTRELRFVVTLLAALGIGIAATLPMLGGLRAWREFYDDGVQRTAAVVDRAVALRSLFVVSPVGAAERAATTGAVDESSSTDPKWTASRIQRERDTLIAGTTALKSSVRVALLGLLLLALLLERRIAVAWSMAAFVPFTFAYPTGDDTMLFAPLLFCATAAPGITTVLFIVEAGSFLATAYWSSPLATELLHWQLSLSCLLAFGGLLLITIRDRTRHTTGARRRSGTVPVGPYAQRAIAVTLLVVAMIVVAGVAIDRERASDRDRAIVLDLWMADVDDVSGGHIVTERMAQRGNGWASDDQLVMRAERVGARFFASLAVARAGTYDVRIEFTTSSDYGIVQVWIGGHPLGVPVNLYTERVGMRHVIYPRVPLDVGDHHLTISVDGKDARATSQDFGIDRVVVRPSRHGAAAPDPEQIAQAGESAFAWVLAHPADAYDGGVADVVIEIRALYRRYRIGVGRSGAELRTRVELERRIAGLTRIPSKHFGIEDREGLREVARIARALDLAFPLFEAETPRHRAAIAQPVDDRVLQLLRRGFDAEDDSWLRQRLETCAADIAAVTEYGTRTDAKVGIGGVDPWVEITNLGLEWAFRATDPLLAARLLTMARDLGIADRLANRARIETWLFDLQEPDGAFGRLSPRRSEPSREAALALGTALMR